jgi:hypothetical protein
MSDYLGLLNQLQPAHKPQHLQSLGGSPTNLERILSNRTHEMAY